MDGPRFTPPRRTAAILAVLLLAGVLTAATLVLTLRVTLSVPPAPMILRGPESPTSSTTATFIFTDEANGVVFQCSLDAGAYSVCANGKTYTGLGDGRHTFRVTARTSSSPVSKPASYGWVVDTGTGEGQLALPGGSASSPSSGRGGPPSSPPAPVITEAPDNPTTATDAEIEYRDSQKGVGFLCSLDGSAFAACPDSDHDGDADYSNLGVGTHTFQVVAIDSAGHRSTPATFTWTIVVVNGSFPIGGNITGLFAPGVTQPLDLSFTNPFGFSLKVLSVTITVQHATTKAGQTNPGCDGPTNMVISQGFTGPVTIPGHTTRSLQALGIPQSQWPHVQMPDLTTNQDACKGTTFTFSYSGTATKG